ncbi:hypothetical protein [Shewanella benthica]|uniref:Uncharacterized protein n=1 Tax=Shewanella benthica KT99 TaxID=314608 RepID=A9DAS9_9GAMM|nr:hypothetical protein [Shewanella benthica]EDQ00636.1 hypothetical protein KT99_03784 [Shewanella benthica KT99]
MPVKLKSKKHLFEAIAGVNAAVTFGIRDDVAEAIGTYLRRVTEVFALKPAASNKHQ